MVLESIGSFSVSLVRVRIRSLEDSGERGRAVVRRVDCCLKVEVTRNGGFSSYSSRGEIN
jgi:hypothetical protein